MHSGGSNHDHLTETELHTVLSTLTPALNGEASFDDILPRLSDLDFIDGASYSVTDDGKSGALTIRVRSEDVVFAFAKLDTGELPEEVKYTLYQRQLYIELYKENPLFYGVARLLGATQHLNLNCVGLQSSLDFFDPKSGFTPDTATREEIEQKISQQVRSVGADALRQIDLIYLEALVNSQVDQSSLCYDAKKIIEKLERMNDHKAFKDADLTSEQRAAITLTAVNRVKFLKSAMSQTKKLLNDRLQAVEDAMSKLDDSDDNTSMMLIPEGKPFDWAHFTEMDAP